MRYNHIFGVHMYGLEIGEQNFREEFDEVDTDYGEGDQYGILHEIIFNEHDELPEGVPDTKGMSLVGGPGYLDYVGFDAIMPYEQCKYTKEQMDKKLHDLTVYLYGEEKAAKIHSKEIFDMWTE